MLRSRALRAVGVAALTAASGWVAVGSSSATATTPTIALASVVTHVNAIRFPDDPGLFFESGIYVKAIGGTFEVDATAKGNSATLVQVSRDHGGVHTIRKITPTAPVNMEEGIPQFFRLVLRNSAGHIMSSGTLPFCPAGVARTDASGRDNPRYPIFCGSPLSRGLVWGIDAGWAAGVSPSVALSPMAKDGEYSLTVSIAASYARQLGVAAAARSATVHLTVTTDTSKGCSPGQPVCPTLPGGAARRSAPPVGEGPNVPGLASAALPSNPLSSTSNGVPDLQALPAHHLTTENNPTDGHDYLDFAATIWNGGSGPLDLEGFRAGSTGLMPVTQFIYRNGHPVRSAKVGRFEFDARPGHDHWHMADVAQYDLLDSTGAHAVRSDKQSFCLAPTDPVNLQVPGAVWQPDTHALWSACQGAGALWIREVLPAGWGDTYFQTVAGQSFDITGLNNGTYQIRVTTDPNHALLETDYTNNASICKIELGGLAGNRTVSSTC